jgi:hypothetical protein
MLRNAYQLCYHLFGAIASKADENDKNRQRSKSENED